MLIPETNYKFKIKYQSQAASDSPQKRQAFITTCYQQGGKPFINALKKWGTNERGDKLTLRSWHYEYAEAIADFRIAETLTTGASQIGKTLLHTLLLCYCLTEGRLNTLWSYDKEISLNVQVPSNFRPVIKKWLEAKGVAVARSEGTQNNTLFQVKGASAHFVYISTSEIKDGDGKAAAGGNVVGVSRDILFKEERSQYPPGADAPLNRRLDAGRLPSRPIRQLGTCGSGLGIELEIETADYYFYPHARCNCGHEFPLNPMGSLLKVVEYRNNKPSYLSESGRPVHWFHHDATNAIASAYFACPSCHQEISKSARVQDAWFRCLRTGLDLRDFLASIPVGYPKQRYKIGLNLTPLLRDTEYNLAEEIIREGLSTFNPNDWVQQRLGLPSETKSTNVDLEMLRRAIASTAPSGNPSVILAGVDQGRGEDWLWICAYYLPVSPGLSFNELVEQSDRVVLFGGDVVRSAIPEKLIEYGVNYGLIDNEPDITDASELCRTTCLEMANQHPGQKDAVVDSTVNDGGLEYPCWQLRNERFLKSVLLGFAINKYHLPHDWDIWLGMPGNERSPITHLTGPSYDPGSGKWKRGKNHVDDLYYAAMFCEAAFYLWLDNYSDNKTISYGGKREIYENIRNY